MSPRPYGKPQQRVILLLGQPVDYTLTRKPVKNLNLRIDRTGRVQVSAPRWVEISQVEAFLRDKAAFVLRGLEQARRRQSLHGDLLPDGEKGKVSLWGKPLHLCRREGEELVKLEGDTLTVQAPTPQRAQQLWQELCARQCRQKAEELFPQALERFGDRLASPPVLRYRRMVSRWGSCSCAQGRITLNTRLAEYPPTALEGVLYHELTHLLCPDHSPAFYRELLLRCPDYRAWTAVLK